VEVEDVVAIHRDLFVVVVEFVSDSMIRDETVAFAEEVEFAMVEDDVEVLVVLVEVDEFVLEVEVALGVVVDDIEVHDVFVDVVEFTNIIMLLEEVVLFGKEVEFVVVEDDLDDSD